MLPPRHALPRQLQRVDSPAAATRCTFSDRAAAGRHRAGGFARRQGALRPLALQGSAAPAHAVAAGEPAIATARIRRSINLATKKLVQLTTTRSRSVQLSDDGKVGLAIHACRTTSSACGATVATTSTSSTRRPARASSSRRRSAGTRSSRPARKYIIVLRRGRTGTRTTSRPARRSTSPRRLKRRALRAGDVEHAERSAGVGHRRLDEGRPVGAHLRSLRHLGGRSDRREARRWWSPIRSAAARTSTFRIVDARPRRRDERFVDTTQAGRGCSAFDEDTKESGFYRDQLGATTRAGEGRDGRRALRRADRRPRNADVVHGHEEHVHRLPEPLGGSERSRRSRRSPTRTRSRRTTTGAPRSS